MPVLDARSSADGRFASRMHLYVPRIILNVYLEYISSRTWRVLPCRLTLETGRYDWTIMTIQNPLVQRIHHDIVNHCTPKSKGLASPRYASVTFLNPSRSHGSASPPPSSGGVLRVREAFGLFPNPRPIRSIITNHFNFVPSHTRSSLSRIKCDRQARQGRRREERDALLGSDGG